MQRYLLREKSIMYMYYRTCTTYPHLENLLFLLPLSSHSPANMDVLVNNTLGSMAATVRTDLDRSVVTATLEAVEDLLKALRPLSFPMQERVLSSLVVSVQDILEDKVS